MWDLHCVSYLAGYIFTTEPPAKPFVVNLYNPFWQALLFPILSVKGTEKFSSLPESHNWKRGRARI